MPPFHFPSALLRNFLNLLRSHCHTARIRKQEKPVRLSMHKAQLFCVGLRVVSRFALRFSADLL